MAQKLYVGGMPFSTTSTELRQWFEPYGSVVSADVITDQATGRSRGFGFVEMTTAEEGRKAVEQLNGHEVEGRRLVVDLAKPKTSGGGGFGAGRRPSGWR
jgi:RNA recognition motif-containing protein